MEGIVSGAEKEIRYGVGLSSIGSILVAASGKAVEDQRPGPMNGPTMPRFQAEDRYA